MKPIETESNTGTESVSAGSAQGGSQCQSHAPSFAKVLDGRKQPIRGLWIRGERYYARLTIEDAAGNKTTRRVPLKDPNGQPVQTRAQAVEAMDRLRVQRADDALPVLHRTPGFSAFADTYLAHIRTGGEHGQAIKKPRTILKEKYHLDGWKEHFGQLRLDLIRLPGINAYVAKRLESGASKRTVKLDIGTLRNVLRHAKDQGWLKTLPTAEMNMRQFKAPIPRRPLFSAGDLDALCASALAMREDGSPVTKNGRQFVEYLRLLAYCGAREREALALRWQDVDFEREQLTIGADGDTKNSESRIVNFNPRLKAHLLDMLTRKTSHWLFPSPQRGVRDIHAKSFRESLKLVRAHAAKARPELAHKAFHDLRHHFASYCVMSGVDFMTTASWLGHKDGGVLIGKVYGHLADSHKKAQAQRLNFGPAIVQAVNQ